jgi:hypothetical protein
MKNLLPIGSVVRLKEAEKSLMIVGTTQVDETGKEYDYIACLYPEGYINETMFWMFNHEDIEDVRYVGYVNAESQVLDLARREAEAKGVSVEDIIKDITGGDSE